MILGSAYEGTAQLVDQPIGQLIYGSMDWPVHFRKVSPILIAWSMLSWHDRLRA